MSAPRLRDNKSNLDVCCDGLLAGNPKRPTRAAATVSQYAQAALKSMTRSGERSGLQRIASAILEHYNHLRRRDCFCISAGGRWHQLARGATPCNV